MTAPLLAAHRISKRIGLRHVLREISFEAEAGNVYALLGANGSGKTTLLHLLAGLSHPTSGQLLWRGKPVGRAEGRYRSGIGFLAHEPLLYGHLTARENLLFFTRLFCEERAGDIPEALRQVGLTRFADDRAGNFSRGMQQRLSLARLWLQSPEVILLDEPFTGLDQQGTQWLEQMIDAWRQDGKLILLSLHEPNQALRISDGFLMLRAGRLEHSGRSSTVDPRELQERMQERHPHG